MKPTPLTTWDGICPVCKCQHQDEHEWIQTRDINERVAWLKTQTYIIPCLDCEDNTWCGKCEDGGVEIVRWAKVVEAFKTPNIHDDLIKKVEDKANDIKKLIKKNEGMK